MKRLAQIFSFLAIVATLVPPLLFFCDRLDLAATKKIMLGAAILWLLATPFWMEHKIKK